MQFGFFANVMNAEILMYCISIHTPSIYLVVKNDPTWDLKLKELKTGIPSNNFERVILNFVNPKLSRMLT